VCQPHASASMKGIVTVTPATITTQASYVAHLSGNQEVPTVPTLAEGMVTAILDGDTLRVTGSFDNLGSAFNTAVGAHLHLGLAGSNGGVVFPLTPTLDVDNLGGTFNEADNRFALNSSQIEQVQAREFYVNVHSVENPAGEIRGQLLPAGKQYFLANLRGSHEPDPVYSPGLGAIIFELDGDSLFASGSFQGIEGNFDGNPAGGVHIHASPVGRNGGIELFLTPTVAVDQKSGTFAAADNGFQLTSAQLDLLAARELYVNLHSTLHPGGELRGQIRGLTQVLFRAALSGANEVPSLVSAGQGQLIGELLGDTLIVSGSFMDLESDYASNIGSHLHLGIAGRNGGVELVLKPLLDGDQRGAVYLPDSNTFVLNATQKNALFNRQIYVNIHSQDQAMGELRGQMLPEAQFVFNAYLGGSQEVAPVLSRGHGVLHGEVRGDQVSVSGSFDDLGSDFASNIGAHLHRGIAGQNGPVILPLTPTLDPDNRGASFFAISNSAALSADLLDSLRSRAVYVNIHSQDINSGELRGQMLQEAQAYFFASLSGAVEVPAPVNSAGSGALVMEYQNSRATLTGSFADLGSDLNTSIAGGVHLHNALPGLSGAVIHLIDTDLASDNQNGVFTAEDNLLIFSTDGLDSLRDGFFYLNIHSQDVASGELRGNLLPLSLAYFNANLGGLNEVNPVLTPGKGSLQAAWNGAQLSVAGSFSDLIGNIDPNIAGGSHLHRGGPDENGPLFAIMNPEVPTTDSTGGAYLARSNAFTLSEGQLDSLFAGDVYFNLHSTEVASGEIRGQLLPEINEFPTDAPSILSPASNSVVVLEDDEATPFEATWTASSDDDELVYLWQLAAASDFSSTILNLNLGASESFLSDFGTVDSILADAGLNVGDSILVYHRAIASDGSLQNIGDTDSVFLKRGDFTTNVVETVEFKLGVQPNPTGDQAQLVIFSPLRGEAKLELIDPQGKVLMSDQLLLIGGPQNYGLRLAQIPTGVYTLRVLPESGEALAIRLIKR
ncbi:MAG: CHRD domain-containing protein, partial [Bacteroidota bacterium]